MKATRYLPISMLGFFLAMAGPVAASSDSDPNDNSSAEYDPAGVPTSVTHPQPKQLTQEDIENSRKQQEQAERDRNWLLLNYEQQLQARDKANASKDQSGNLYYQLSSNKEMAKLAGLPSIDSQEATTGTVHASPSAVSLRADAPSTGLSLSHADLFKPLVTPLSAPEAAGLHNFYSSLASPFSGISSTVPQASPGYKTDQYEESLDLETPGMVAAKNPLTDTSHADLTLDVLPGESIEQAQAHQDSNAKLELQGPMDADQLHKQQTGALSPPTAPNASKTTAANPAPTPAVPTADPSAPTPVSEAPQVNPVRGPIANPYDILDR